MEEEKVESNIAEVNAAAERLEKAAADARAETERLKAVQLEAELGGQSETVEPVKEESNIEYAQKAMRGELNVKDN